MINEIEFLFPFFALMNNPKITGNKNNSRNTSNRRLNANEVNPIKNSEISKSITSPYIEFENWNIIKLMIITITCVIITKFFSFFGISDNNVIIIDMGSINTVIAFEKIDNK